MLKNVLLFVTLLACCGLKLLAVPLPQGSSDFTYKQEKQLCPKKTSNSLKAIERTSDRSLSELGLREQEPTRLLKRIPLTFGFVVFSESSETLPISRQLPGGVLFCKSCLKTYTDPSTHPLYTRGPPA